MPSIRCCICLEVAVAAKASGEVKFCCARPCGHVFHLDCFNQYLASRLPDNTPPCPYCKQSTRSQQRLYIDFGDEADEAKASSPSVPRQDREQLTNAKLRVKSLELELAECNGKVKEAQDLQQQAEQWSAQLQDKVGKQEERLRKLDTANQRLQASEAALESRLETIAGCHRRKRQFDKDIIEQQKAQIEKERREKEKLQAVVDALAMTERCDLSDFELHKIRERSERFYKFAQDKNGAAMFMEALQEQRSQYNERMEQMREVTKQKDSLQRLAAQLQGEVVKLKAQLQQQQQTRPPLAELPNASAAPSTSNRPAAQSLKRAVCGSKPHDSSEGGGGVGLGMEVERWGRHNSSEGDGAARVQEEHDDDMIIRLSDDEPYEPCSQGAGMPRGGSQVCVSGRSSQEDWRDGGSLLGSGAGVEQLALECGLALQAVPLAGSMLHRLPPSFASAAPRPATYIQQGADGRGGRTTVLRNSSGGSFSMGVKRPMLSHTSKAKPGGKKARQGAVKISQFFGAK